MRKLAWVAMVGVSLGMGLPYALNGYWWGLLTSLLAGALWCYPSPFKADLRSTLSLAILVCIGALGIFFGHSQMGLLTNFVLLLIAWDLDYYTRVFQKFEQDQVSEESASILFSAHLKRLGFIAGLGWVIGIVALNIRIQISFGLALLLILLMVISLYQVARHLVSVQK